MDPNRVRELLLRHQPVLDLMPKPEAESWSGSRSHVNQHFYTLFGRVQVISVNYFLAMEDSDAFRDRFHQGDWLRRSIAEGGETITAFSNRTGISRDAINKWLSQEHLQIRLDNAVLVVKSLGYDPKKLFDEGELEFALGGMKKDAGIMSQLAAADAAQRLIIRAMSTLWGGRQKAAFPRLAEPEVPLDRGVDPLTVEPVSDIPIFDLSVAAGPWADVSEVGEVYRPGQIDCGLFRVHIAGDSMMPKYRSGEIIEFRVVRFGVDSLEIGADYYVQKDDDATFKRLEKVTDEMYILRAINVKKYPRAMSVPHQSVRRMAIATGWFKPVERGRS